MEVDVYTDFGKDIENIWTDFEKIAVMTPFQSFAWLSHWQDTVGGPLFAVKPQIVHVYNEESTVAIMPLGIRKIMGIKILEWLGGTNSDYMGPLVYPDFNDHFETKDLWEEMKSRFLNYNVIHLQKQPKWVVELLDHIGFSSSCNQHLKAYKIEIPEDWDTYFNGIKKRMRSDSRRQRRRLKEIGDINFNFSERLKDKTEIIQSMITQKSRRYREIGVKDMLAIEEYQQFYQGLAYFSSDNIKIHCSSLNVNEVMVATHVGFVDKNTFYYLMPAHECGEWLRYSTGRLLLLELIKWSIEKGLKYFDFTIGGEDYKQDWCNQKELLYYYLISNSILGKLYITLIKLKLYLKEQPIVKYLRRLFIG